VHGVELPITLLDRASPFVPGMAMPIWFGRTPTHVALRLTRCQGKDLIAEA